jgi:hypothetical protein
MRLRCSDGNGRWTTSASRLSANAGHRGGVQRLPLGDEPLGSPPVLGEGGLAVLLDVIEGVRDAPAPDMWSLHRPADMLVGRLGR